MNMILTGTVIDSNQVGDRSVDRDRLVGYSWYNVSVFVCFI